MFTMRSRWTTVYLPSPVPLAEDLAVVDLVSRGRVSCVIGLGYRDEEFGGLPPDLARRYLETAASAASPA
jgi:alkanesulfonate monooxygenase SsuD/methylene tetrahydromethanopterin reductase-like flavin-dependent oxidoreductase (luciferase family)